MSISKEVRQVSHKRSRTCKNSQSRNQNDKNGKHMLEYDFTTRFNYTRINETTQDRRRTVVDSGRLLDPLFQTIIIVPISLTQKQFSLDCNCITIFCWWYKQQSRLYLR